MNLWEVFVTDMSELVEDEELELTVRTLNPGIHKYTYKRVKAQIDSSLDAFADRLQVRFGRGQLSKKQFAINVTGEVQRFPDKYL